jgi:hypothetical protein
MILFLISPGRPKRALEGVGVDMAGDVQREAKDTPWLLADDDMRA